LTGEGRQGEQGEQGEKKLDFLTINRAKKLLWWTTSKAIALLFQRELIEEAGGLPKGDKGTFPV
jgi:hypothetical protein